MRPEFTRAFDMRPATFDPEALTVEAVLSSGAAVTRRDARGPYVERLELDAINPADLVGLTVFADHVETTRAAVGSVVDARREGDELVVGIRLSRAPDVESVRVKVAEGTVRGVSAGYSVKRWADSIDPSGRRVRTAVEWRVHEVSLVGRPADPRSIIRSNEVEPNTPDPAVVETRAAIREVARKAGLNPAWADSQIDAGADVTAARAAAFEAMEAHRPAIRPSVGFSNDDPEIVNRRAVEALAADAAGVPVEDQGANQYRGLGFTGLARTILAGEPAINRMGNAQLIERAHTFTRSGGYMGVSDFVQALSGTVSRVALATYREAESPIEAKLVTYRTVPDFRPVTLLRRGGLPNLMPISEHGEVRSVSTVEAGESIQAGTYAATVGLSRTAQINDDTGLLGDFASDLGRSARRTLTQAIIDLMTSNSGAGPVMADGENLFDSAHANLAASGAALSETTLPVAIQAVQAQTGLGGEIIGIRPAYLVVSPALEFTARKLLASIDPTTADDVNPLSGLLELIVDPRLAGNGWYVFAKPSDAAVLQVATLAGQSGPIITVKEGWDTLGTSWRAVFDFGVAAIDFRGAYRNAGA